MRSRPGPGKEWVHEGWGERPRAYGGDGDGWWRFAHAGPGSRRWGGGRRAGGLGRGGRHCGNRSWAGAPREGDGVVGGRPEGRRNPGQAVGGRRGRRRPYQPGTAVSGRPGGKG